MSSDFVTAARAWLAIDPDPGTRAELEALLRAGDEATLAERFSGRLEFGTAGLRGEMGAGPTRMNRVVVRQAAAGLARWLLAGGDGGQVNPAAAGVAVGFDARHRSDVFAEDTVRVLAAAGVQAMLLPGPLPTPLLAFAVRHLGAAAGVMVTASHNPSADNGYKVYLADGSQIVAPIDRAISDHIEEVAAATGSAIALAEADDPRIERLDDRVRVAYLTHVADLSMTSARTVRVVYTAMHGVGRDTLLAAFDRAGFPAPTVVAAQSAPDPDFPTVSFPNPEEPGAMDLLLDSARQVEADVALANDPDADRLGVAIPDQSADGGWRPLNGNEIGWLLADHVLSHTTGDDRLVVTTLVSSLLLERMAADYGVHHERTLTGFKWIADAVRRHSSEHLRFVFGYEEALGYLADPEGRDKDGISAALAFAELTALAKENGSDVASRLDELARRYGRHRTLGWSLRAEPSAIADVIDSLRSDPPTVLGGHKVDEVAFVDDANLLTFTLADGAGRVLVRPSGTEPKCKVYIEVVNGDPEPVLDDVRAALHG